MQQAILTGSVILAYVLLTQYGRRRLAWHRWLPAVILIPVAAVVYLSRAPAQRYDIYAYLVAAAAGCLCGALAAAVTSVERDQRTGRLYTRCGPAFAAVWAVALGTRVAFIWALQDVPWFTRIAGAFFRDHQIGRSAIAAAFVLMAVVMYGLRFAVIAVQARGLPVRQATVPDIRQSKPVGLDRQGPAPVDHRRMSPGAAGNERGQFDAG